MHIVNSEREMTARRRAMLMPVSNRRHPCSGWLPRTSGIVTIRIAAIRKRYVAALTRNSCDVVAPTRASSAASAGPRTRLAFIITEFKLTAPARSARLTSSGTLAWNAGAFSALPVPMTSDMANSVHSGALVATSTARTTLNTIWMACMAMRYGSRGNRSASTPAGIDSTAADRAA